MATFGKAFAAARKAGEKEFTFNGKKFHTRTKEEDVELKRNTEDQRRLQAAAASERAKMDTPTGRVKRMVDEAVDAGRAREGAKQYGRETDSMRNASRAARKTPAMAAGGKVKRGYGMARCK